MCIKNEINYIQKRLLERLNVKNRSTLFTIIEAISQQAYAKASFVVSQKNSTLAVKCDVTASTISRNLKKIKDKCSDLIQIEQNRNVSEQFASLVFTLIPQEKRCPEMGLPSKRQTDMSNGKQTEECNGDAEFHDIAESPSRSFSNHSEVYISTHNKVINNSIVNKEDVEQNDIIHDEYVHARKNGISTKMFFKVIDEIKNKNNIRNLKSYIRGTINNIINHISFRDGTKTYNNPMNQIFYQWLHE
ncbi:MULTISPECIES: hypothetical protein [Bacillus]|uniref:hypothetical protein n=1 Tax=Bacillus TaxID=1386 RepID=UPI00077AF144|nr:MULTISPECIES: hypothetical protein [Bacillus cereus group]KXY76768.1 hypothetical protein AT270_10780 [Bacillus cereus]MBG9938495.1 hypothetical protein [Bacillus tropicus]MED2995287.1 hypothetical protein [Bacillus tropicus]OTY52039.1 hypothetical protein BK748_21060 [Bacillus thuringiensis serovar graciosensis]